MDTEILYEGKSKKIIKGEEEGTILVWFKDTLTAGDGAKKLDVEGKGGLTADISIHLFEVLNREGIQTHFIERHNNRSFVARELSIIPVELVVRNIATGSIIKRLGIEKGKSFSPPLLEFFYKSDELHDPIICEQHIYLLNLAGEDEVNEIKSTALDTNSILRDYLNQFGLELVDIKFEFGKDRKGNIYLADEISPDTFRVWDKNTGESLDKDVFREATRDPFSVYSELKERLKL